MKTTALLALTVALAACAGPEPTGHIAVAWHTVDANGDPAPCWVGDSENRQEIRLHVEGPISTDYVITCSAVESIGTQHLSDVNYPVGEYVLTFTLVNKSYETIVDPVDEQTITLDVTDALVTYAPDVTLSVD